MHTSLHLDMPAWLPAALDQAPLGQTSSEAWMQFVIGLSSRNVDEQTGGPFAAAVVDSAATLIAAAVNVVMPGRCSAAHGEVMALSLAQQSAGTHDLSTLAHQPLTLYTSCEPCTMCLGATCWSGVKRVVCGATDADARASGFNEGPKPHDVPAALKAQGIQWTTGIHRQDAVAVLQRYVSQGTIYNPGTLTT